MQNSKIVNLGVCAFTKHLQFQRGEISKLIVVTRKIWIKWKIKVMLPKQLTAKQEEVERPLKMYVNETLTSGGECGWFFLWRSSSSGCVVRSDVSTGTAAQPCISPKTIIWFQFLNSTGLKSNRTNNNSTTILISKWKVLQIHQQMAFCSFWDGWPAGASLFMREIKCQTLTFFFCTWPCSFSEALDGFRRSMSVVSVYRPSGVWKSRSCQRDESHRQRKRQKKSASLIAGVQN